MKEKEIWKDIPGYEGLYRVNQWGDIYSLYTNKKLKWSIHKDGYKIYNLHINGKRYLMTAHRAVALAFIPNPNNLPIINHKDEDKQNCYVDNLEWCTIKYNNIYSNNGKRSGEKTAKKVYCYNKDGTLYKIYLSLKEAAKDLNISDTNISTIAQWRDYTPGKKNIVSIKNKTFSFVERNKQEVIERMQKADEKRLGNKNNILSKKIQQLTLDNKLLQTFPSTCEAYRQTGIASTQIGRAARGYDKGYICHGYRWKYVD